MTEDLQHVGLFVCPEKRAGDPFLDGSMAGVLVSDPDRTGFATVALSGTYRLPVTGEKQIEVETPLYFNQSTGRLSDNPKSGPMFGYAMATLGAGSSAVIPVEIKQ